MARGPAATIRTPQRRPGRERVARLTAAAEAVFVEKGYDAATMTEIAARAGASIGSLYLFFPTKQALAHAMLGALGDTLSERLERLQQRVAGHPPSAIADALFAELVAFAADHPAYAALLDLPGDDAWRIALRAARRTQIAALFARAEPKLPAGQGDRLALIVPQLMRIALAADAPGGGAAITPGGGAAITPGGGAAITPGGGAAIAPAGPAAIAEELRAMLHRHLAPEAASRG